MRFYWFPPAVSWHLLNGSMLSHMSVLSICLLTWSDRSARHKKEKKEKCTWSSLRKPTRIFCARCELLFSGEQVSEWAPLSNIRPRSGRYLCSSSHRLTRCLYNLLFPPPLLWLDACHQLPTWTKPGRGKRAAGSACHIPVQALTLFLHGDLSRL